MDISEETAELYQTFLARIAQNSMQAYQDFQQAANTNQELVSYTFLRAGFNPISSANVFLHSIAIGNDKMRILERDYPTVALRMKISKALALNDAEMIHDLRDQDPGLFNTIFTNAQHGILHALNPEHVEQITGIIGANAE
jgi:hypothetical protein